MRTPPPQTPARFTAEDFRRPPTRLRDAVTTLRHFAIVSYAVTPDALARHLPAGFDPEVRSLGDGRPAAFVSAVPFVDVDFRAGFAPFYRLRMGQTNYRAYVIHRGRRAVWFFGTTLSGVWIWVPRHLWRLPWHPARIAIDAAYREGSCSRYDMRGDGAWGAAELSLRGTGEPMGRLDGFHDEEDTAVVLTHPLVGYYRRRDGALGSYSVWHDRLRLERAVVARARFAVFERLGLVEPGAPPHSALVQAETEFVVRLPPVRLGPDVAGNDDGEGTVEGL